MTGQKITLRRYLFFQAMIAQPGQPSVETREVVDTVQEELVAMGWNPEERKTWEQWKETGLL